MGQICDFLRSDSKCTESNLTKSQICPIWGHYDPNCGQLWHDNDIPSYIIIIILCSLVSSVHSNQLCLGLEIDWLFLDSEIHNGIIYYQNNYLLIGPTIITAGRGRIFLFMTSLHFCVRLSVCMFSHLLCETIIVQKSFVYGLIT